MLRCFLRCGGVRYLTSLWEGGKGDQDLLGSAALPYQRGWMADACARDVCAPDLISASLSVAAVGLSGFQNYQPCPVSLPEGDGLFLHIETVTLHML